MSKKERKFCKKCGVKLSNPESIADEKCRQCSGKVSKAVPKATTVLRSFK